MECLGIHPVLEQRGNRSEKLQWHLHQDLSITLALKREENIWVRPDEGYREIARLRHDAEGKPVLLEIRASHLRDYLCARDMALYVTSYRNRDVIVEDASAINWSNGLLEERDASDHWMGRVSAIHEGGSPFGSSMAVLHLERTDVDFLEDVPTIGLPEEGNSRSTHWTREAHGRKLYRISGELWRNEWVEPARQSFIVRGDEETSLVQFIVDAEGTKKSGTELRGDGRWLWFKPELIQSLISSRGGELAWHTRDTGSVRCSPDYEVVFGVNPLGLVNVYAKDIGFLPQWQQAIWSGQNVSPEGKVAQELLASQAVGTPANTQAPEKFFAVALARLSEISSTALGTSIVGSHEQTDAILRRIHRFRAVDNPGLYSLAKDVARLTADSFDAATIQSFGVKPPKGERWQSLKSLEKLLATRVAEDLARIMMGPLFAAYELRHADAHLPKGEIDEYLALARIDKSAPTVTQGYQLLHSIVSSLWGIGSVIEEHWQREDNPLI